MDELNNDEQKTLIENLKKEIYLQYKEYISILREREVKAKEISEQFMMSEYLTKKGFLKNNPIPNKEYMELKSKSLLSEKKFRAMTSTFYVLKSANVTVY